MKSKLFRILIAVTGSICLVGALVGFGVKGEALAIASITYGLIAGWAVGY
jgi:hypothetical protein